MSNRYAFNKKKANKERKSGIIVALILLILVLGVIAFAAARNFFSESPANFVNVPVIQTQLVSADGNMHMFGTRVVLELDDNAPEIDQNELYTAVMAAVSSLAYEDITDFYGMENLRSAVRHKLSDRFGEDQLLGVYFAQFLSDFPLPNLEEDNIPGRNPFLDMFLDN